MTRSPWWRHSEASCSASVTRLSTSSNGQAASFHFGSRFPRAAFRRNMTRRSTTHSTGSIDTLNGSTSCPRSQASNGLRTTSGCWRGRCAAPGGDVRAGSLAKVFELCRAAMREQVSMVDLVDYLERLITADEKYDGISVRPHARPVVRLMNLHKVKGLEAPVVFLARPDGELRAPDRPAHRPLRRLCARLHGGLCTKTGNWFRHASYDRMPSRVGAV